MKKVILFIAASAVIAACSKNELVPAGDAGSAEITYLTAPKTKADPSKDNFDKSNVFASWAYYLPSDKSWSENRLEAQEYIVNSLISYQTETGSWKDTSSIHYWPKSGKLTFFAYSLNKGDLNLKHNVSQSHFACYNSEDSCGINGQIDLDENPNTDFLVAQIAMDKSGNATTYYTNGVPTLFRHRLTRIAFTVKKSADYANKKFTLNAIKFHNLSHAMNYEQFHKTDDGNLAEYGYESGSRTTQVYTETALPVESLKSTPVPGENEVRYIYIPQTFKGKNETATIEISYTVTTTVNGKEVDDVCKETINVKNYFEKWEMGKRYIINLTFGLEEILWDPAVEDWTDESSQDIMIGA